MKAGKDFDVVVVGGGVGGVAAVRKLASAGLSVALVEDRLVGGECHYWGCNPSKTLLRPIEVFNLAKAVPGVREAISGEGLDVAAVFAKRDAIIEHLSDQDRIASLRQAGVAVFHGFGRLSGQRTVRVAHADNTEAVLRHATRSLLATGTRPNVPRDTWVGASTPVDQSGLNDHDTSATSRAGGGWRPRRCRVRDHPDRFGLRGNTSGTWEHPASQLRTRSPRAGRAVTAKQRRHDSL